MQKMPLKLVSVGVFALIAVIAIKAFLILVNRNEIDQKQKENNKILITASFYPLYFFSQEIAGNQAEVINLTKTGVEPHEFEPSTKDLLTLNKSQLLIVNGLSFESWLEEFAREPENQHLEILKTAEGLTALEHEQKLTDPHVWLDPVLAQAQVKVITQKLKEIDAINSNFYEQNQEKLITELQKLDQEFKSGLANCQKNKIITSHAAFAYLAKRYNFEQIAIQGLNPEEDPSPQKIATAAKLAKEHKLNYIFFETLVSPKIAQTIAKETGASTLVFNPIEGLNKEDEINGKNYFSIQRENLANLRLALNCQ